MTKVKKELQKPTISWSVFVVTAGVLFAIAALMFIFADTLTMYN